MRTLTVCRVAAYRRDAWTALVLAALLAACDPVTVEPVTGGDPVEGERLIHRFGCPACHTIPGVARADGLVGPPLGGLRERVYIGGVLPNTPENLVAWILDPRRHSPKTAMPNLGASDAQARDIAAYLYSH